ncbi:hypothetical protein EIP86_005628 [Pleurotus ostreatoroseus]|nr:hypothetical protein EIP86_005628 [Pleurotus ostreatoroseus]
MDLFHTTMKPIEQVVKDANLKKKHINEGINPDDAVAYGAAVQSGILAGDESLGDVVLVDVNSLTLGIETAGAWASLSSIAPRGVPQIEFIFKINANGVLNVKAADKGIDQSESITIKDEKGRLSREEIDRMVQEAEEYMAEPQQNSGAEDLSGLTIEQLKRLLPLDLWDLGDFLVYETDRILDDGEATFEEVNDPGFFDRRYPYQAKILAAISARYEADAATSDPQSSTTVVHRSSVGDTASGVNAGEVRAKEADGAGDPVCIKQ